jgi:hypothetical protein
VYLIKGLHNIAQFTTLGACFQNEMADRRVKEILLNCLYSICSDDPWEYGEAWVADHRGSLQLAVHKVSKKCKIAASEFIRRSVSLKLSPSNSLPGSVISAKKRLFWDLEKLIEDHDRGQLVVTSKFKCCLGLPVFTVKTNSFVGVLLLFSTFAVSPLSNDNIEFAAAVADTAATQVDELNISHESIQEFFDNGYLQQSTNDLLSFNTHPIEILGNAFSLQNDSPQQKVSPPVPISKSFLRAASTVKEKPIDWNSTLLMIQAVLAKHSSSSQESERQRITKICSIFYEVGSTNNMATAESIRLLMETLQSFIFVSNPGISPTAFPQRCLSTELLAHSQKELSKSISELTEIKNKAVLDSQMFLHQKLQLEAKIAELQSELRKKSESGKLIKNELLKTTLEFHFDRLGVPDELQPKYSETSKRMQTALSRIEDQTALDDKVSSLRQAKEDCNLLVSRISEPLSNRITFLKKIVAGTKQLYSSHQFEKSPSAHLKGIQVEIQHCNLELEEMKLLLIEVTGCLHGKLDILENKLQLHIGHKLGEQEAIFNFQADAEKLCSEIAEQRLHWTKISLKLQELLNEHRSLTGAEFSELEIELDIFENLSIAQRQSNAAHWVSLKKHSSSVLLTSVHRKMTVTSLIQLLFSAFEFVYESFKTSFANAQSSTFTHMFDAPFFEFMNLRYAMPEIAFTVCRDLFSFLDSLKSIKLLPVVFLKSFSVDQYNFQWQYAFFFRKYHVSHRSLNQPFVSTAEALKFLTASMYAEINSSLLDPVLAKFLVWKKKNIMRDADVTANDFVEFMCCLLDAGLEPRVERCRFYCQQNARNILTGEFLYTHFEQICNELIIGSSRGSIGEHAQEHYGSIRSLQAAGVDISIDMLAHKLAIVQIVVLVDDAHNSMCKAGVVIVK